MLRLLLWPFRLARMLLWRVIWHAVHFLLRFPPLFVLVVWGLLSLGLYAGWQALKTHHAEVATVRQTETATPTATGKSATGANGKAIPDVNAAHIENGNSAFASNILDRMQKIEREAYSREFYKAMQTVQPGVEYRWRVAPDVYGSETPRDTFAAARQGLYCRHFFEKLSIHGQAQQLDGMACQRAEGGWCKLLPSEVPSCAFVEPTGWDLWQRGIKDKLGNWMRMF